MYCIGTKKIVYITVIRKRVIQKRQKEKERKTVKSYYVHKTQKLDFIYHYNCIRFLK